MRLATAADAWDRDGFVVLPAYMSAEQLAPAVAELGWVFPTAGWSVQGPR